MCARTRAASCAVLHHPVSSMRPVPPLAHMHSKPQTRAQGNQAFSSGQLVRAIQLYGEALQLAPDSGLLYSNR